MIPRYVGWTGRGRACQFRSEYSLARRINHLVLVESLSAGRLRAGRGGCRHAAECGRMPDDICSTLYIGKCAWAVFLCSLLEFSFWAKGPAVW